MAEKIASLYAEIYADTSKLEQGLNSAKNGLRDTDKQFANTQNAAKSASSGFANFASALGSGKTTTADFTDSLLASAKAMGLSEGKTLLMAQASGLYTKEQISAASSSVLVSKKAEELATAVSKGEMSVTQAGKAFGEYAKAHQTAEKSQVDFGKTLKSLMTTMTAIVGVAAAAGVAIKKAFDFTREGAAVIQTEKAFSSMLSTIGAGSDVLDEWRTAVNGTISDIDLMSGFQTVAAGTSKELTQSFYENNAALLKISKAASALNPQLGDTAFMYESITKGIKRQSPLILDNLGLVVKVGEANKKYAAQLGKSVEQLTAEEKQMALLNGVLEQGDVLVSQLGGSVEAATDPWDKFTTSLKNYYDAAKKANVATSDYGGLFGWISEQLDTETKYQNALTDAYASGVITLDEYKEAQRKVTNFSWSMSEATEWANEQIEDYNTFVSESARLTDEWALANDQGYASLQNTASGVSDVNIAFMDVNLAMQEYNRQLLFSMAAEGLTAEQAYILAERMGLVDETTVAAYGAIGDLQEELAETDDINAYADAATRLADGLDRLPADKHVRVVYTEVYNRVMGTGYANSGGVTGMTDTGGSGGTNNTPPKPGLPPLPGASNEALGGFYETSTPTLYRASETGQPETAIFVPQGKSIYDVATPQQVAKVMPDGGMGNVTNNYYFDAVEADRIPQTIEQLKVLAL